MSGAIRTFFTPTYQGTPASVGLLLLRLVAGLAFLFHGWGKIQNPLSWMGPDSGVPAVLQLLAAVSEFGGGLAWILGLLTSLASLGIAFTMLVATYFHMIVRGDPFVNMSGGASYELAALFLVIAILFMTVGAGRFSIDRFLFGEK
ncbi:MAG: DoxX family protein [Spirochaetales bacterium]|nr:DoxX family protein [Leptospiraceae bacterium]MCP5481297.1 DoxX family protein [Spirochaetales bacterium]MCP5485733.1 DoxX family protein [Spirochaetales bacterium]